MIGPVLAGMCVAALAASWVLTNDTGGKGGGVPDGVLGEFSAKTGALVLQIIAGDAAPATAG